MAQLIQTNIMIARQNSGCYRLFGSVYFMMGKNEYAYDVDVYEDLKTGDPLVNGQLEELMLKFAEALHSIEKHGIDSRFCRPFMQE